MLGAALVHGHLALIADHSVGLRKSRLTRAASCQKIGGEERQLQNINAMATAKASANANADANADANANADEARNEAKGTS